MLSSKKNALHAVLVELNVFHGKDHYQPVAHQNWH